MHLDHKTFPLLFDVAKSLPSSSRRYGGRGEYFYSVVDGAFAAMLVMLAAVNEGLGAGFVGAFRDDEVRSVLGLPEAARPIGIIPIGFRAERPEKLHRLSEEQIIHYEQWKEAA
jgi:nitroreductase